MASEKADGGTRRRHLKGLGKSEPAAGKDAAPGITLVDIDPGASWRSCGSTPTKAQPADNERSDERKTNTRMPAKKPRPRRSARSRESSPHHSDAGSDHPPAGAVRTAPQDAMRPRGTCG